MERATNLDKDRWYINGAKVRMVFHSGTGEIRLRGQDIDRLAAYEDTGLEPEEIQKLKAEAEKPKRTVSDLIRNMRGDELLELIEEIRIHCCPPLCDQNHYCDEDCHKGIAAWLNGSADERILAYLKRPKNEGGSK